MSEEIENRESRGEQKPSDVVVFSPEVLAMADRRRRPEGRGAGDMPPGGGGRRLTGTGADGTALYLRDARRRARREEGL